MKTKHLHYSDDKCFCVVTVGADLTTYTYCDTREEAEWIMHSGQAMLDMLGIKTTSHLFEREQERKIEGFYKHELN